MAKDEPKVTTSKPIVDVDETPVTPETPVENVNVTVELNNPEDVAAVENAKPKLEDTKEFKELVENNTLAQLRTRLVEAEMLGAEYITDKKAAAAAILTLEKRKVERAPEADRPVVAPIAPTAQEKKALETWTAKMKAMKEYCAKAPKIRVMIPFDIGERPGASIEMQINGYKLTALKGVYLDLPQPFADMVQESWKQTMEAGSEKLLDRIDPDTGKPMSESQALA